LVVHHLANGKMESQCVASVQWTSSLGDDLHDAWILDAVIWPDSQVQLWVCLHWHDLPVCGSQCHISSSRRDEESNWSLEEM
jgi:hypothetical protein